MTSHPLIGKINVPGRHSKRFMSESNAAVKHLHTYNNKLRNVNDCVDSCKSSLRSFYLYLLALFFSLAWFHTSSTTRLLKKQARHGVTVPQQFSSLLVTRQIFIHDFFVANASSILFHLAPCHFFRVLSSSRSI